MLYKEASRILQCISDKKGSIKNLVLSSKFKNKKQLFALVCETLKYKDVLTTIIQNTKVQKRERILKQDCLVLVLLFDFLLGKGLHGQSDKFKEAILKHKAALQSELARLKVKAKTNKNEDLLPTKVKDEVVLPRYVRVNTLKTTVEDVMEHFKRDGFSLVPVQVINYNRYIETISNLKPKQFIQDLHIPELVVFAAGTDLHDHVLYRNGSIIFQDKASCLPAHILSPPPGVHVIDCCAAPGNKTSHLAALMSNKGFIYAFDKDLKRVTTMNTMLLKAGVLCTDITHMDFLKTDPFDSKYKEVEYILVDPSCSGSGIVNRRNEMTDDSESSSSTRLENLSKFQVMVLRHALSFPKVKRVIYSTCSNHQVENEAVVCEAMEKAENHFDLVSILRGFPNRGFKVNSDSDFKSKRCVRMDPKTDLTNGFFIACLARKESIDGKTEEQQIFTKLSVTDNCDKPVVTAKTTVKDQPVVTAKTTVKDQQEHVKSKKQKKHHDGHAAGTGQITDKRTPVNERTKQSQTKKKKRNKVHKTQNTTVITSVDKNQTTSSLLQKDSKKKKKNRPRKHKPVTL